MSEKIKEDFLPIPEFPNYEINSRLIVRSKKTGRILKATPKLNSVHLYRDKKGFSRTIKTLRVQAESVLDTRDWQPIPSLKNLYEITPEGDVRNAKTKKILKVPEDNCCRFHKVGVKRHIKDLLWEVHGILYRPPHLPVSVVIRKNNEAYYFKTLTTAAHFLSKHVPLAESYIKFRLVKRKAEIYGWAITYHDEKSLASVETPKFKVRNSKVFFV